jgi:hypothetical protein
MPKNKPEDAREIEEIEQEAQESVEDLVEKTTLGFQRNGGPGLVVRGGTIKAHLKDCANQIKDVVPNPKPVKSESKTGIKAFRSKVANRVYVDEYWVPLLREGQPVQEEDGSYEQPVHVMTPMGPRNALKVIRFVEKPTLRFTLRVLRDRQVTADTIKAILEYGAIHGYGGERGMGEGRYTFSLKEI